MVELRSTPGTLHWPLSYQMCTDVSIGSVNVYIDILLLSIKYSVVI